MKIIKRLWRVSRRLHQASSTLAPRLVVSREAQDFIRREVEGFRRDLETGGILMGRSESASIITVTHASGPGPNAIHEPTYFLRDTAYCAAVLRDHYERFGIDYVGEWHSHTDLLRHPSGGDLLTLSRIMSDPDYDFTIFAMLLAVGSGKRRHRIDLHGFIATQSDIFEVAVEAVESDGR